MREQIATLTSLRDQLMEQQRARAAESEQTLAQKDEQLSEMASKLEASHGDARDTATRLAELQVQLQRLASHDDKVHSLQEELDSKDSAINVSARPAGPAVFRISNSSPVRVFWWALAWKYL